MEALKSYLLTLPVEVLHRILECVPDQKQQDEAWRSAIVDTSMLLPISRTCRRLRDITNSCPALWGSVSVAAEPVLSGLTQTAITHSRSRPLSVELLLDQSYSQADPDGRKVKALWPSIAPRAREVHLIISARDTVAEPWDPVFDHPYPTLESFTFYNLTPPRPVPFLPNAQGSVSQLRRLDLRSGGIQVPQCDFPKLTHLALQNVSVTSASMVGLLGRCPNLESLIMRNIVQQIWDPQVHADLSLPRLRRVVLKNIRYTALPYYLETIPKHSNGYSLQVIGVPCHPSFFDAAAFLHDHSPLPPHTIRIGTEPSPDSEIWHALSVTLLSSQSLVRLGTSVRPSSDLADGPAWLGRTLEDKSALVTITELWLVDLPRAVSSSNWWDSFDESLRSVLAALPMLEVVSIAYNHSHHTAVPDLRLLPDGREPGFDARRLKTVRFVHGYDRELEYRQVLKAGQYEELLRPREGKELSLAIMLNQLQTGAFDYLARVVLRVASRFFFDEAELAQLRGRSVQVDIEYSDERPEMPIPEYAREQEASGNPSYWAGVFY